MFLSMKREEERREKEEITGELTMSNVDNNMNINKTSRAYTPSVSKNDNNKSVQQREEVAQESLNDGTQAADSYGRILVKSGKVDNAEMVQSVKDSIDFFVNNPELAAAAVKAGDDAEELMSALEVADAYEKACCGACEAAYSKVN